MENRLVKKCPGCNRELPTTEFYRNRTKGDGLTSYCKECTKTINILSAEKRKDSTMVKESKTITPSVVETTESVPSVPVQVVKSLKDYTPRELLAELKARGYVWETMYKKEYVSYSKI